MAERGRKPKGNYKQKTQVFSTRIREDTKAFLESSAKNRGHSLSQEVEMRLRRSVDEDQNLIEKLGGRENYAVLRLISGLMSSVWNPAGDKGSWLHDPYCFAQLVKAITAVLAELRPPGDPEVPAVEGPMGEGIEALASLQGNMRAAELLLAVKEAPPELPLTRDDPAPFIRQGLGDAANRIGNQKGRRIVRGTADDFRRAAREMKRDTDEETSS
jgi:hypothetical protein